MLVGVVVLLQTSQQATLGADILETFKVIEHKWVVIGLPHDSTVDASLKVLIMEVEGLPNEIALVNNQFVNFSVGQWLHVNRVFFETLQLWFIGMSIVFFEFVLESDPQLDLLCQLFFQVLDVVLNGFILFDVFLVIWFIGVGIWV